MKHFFRMLIFANLLALCIFSEESLAVSTVRASPPNVTFKSGSTMQFNKSIMPKLEKIASKLKRRIVVTSGWRSKAHNRKIGGAPKSAHLTGNAVDIREQSNPKSLAARVYSTRIFPQALWNSCRPHVHLATDRNGHFDECGGKYQRSRKSKVSGKKKTPKKPKKRARKKR